MAQTDFSGPIIITGETNYAGSIVAPTVPTPKTTDLILVGGQTTPQIIGGSGGIAFRNNANNANTLSISDTGGVTGVNLTNTGYARLGGGPTAGLQLGTAPGGANAYQLFTKEVTGILDSTATTIVTITIPNVNASAVLEILVISGITAAAHIYDSTRVAKYTCAITRVAGANAVVVLSAVFAAQIATVSSGQTLTTALTAAAVSGAVGASNACDLQITNAVSVAGTSETSLIIQLYNSAAGGVTLS